MRPRLIRLVLVAAALLLPRPSPAQTQPENCSVGAQNQYVRHVMYDYYLWYRDMPTVNPYRYVSPERYLEAIRHRPLDTTFSYITSRAEHEALFSSSQYVGLGFSTQLEGSSLRIAQVFPDSPAAAAGIARGDRITSIQGRPISELITTGDIGGAFGAAAEGVVVELAWRGGDGVERRAQLAKRAVIIPTVSTTRLYEVGGRRVGYIFFRNFVEPSVAALDAAFASLRAGGATELVLDLRYNGGGLVSVARHLGGLIGGRLTQGQVFAEFFHNDRQAALNQAFRFEDKAQSLNLSRLVVITTRASASASELIVNALRPFIPVVIVGGTTYGKPVGQYGFTFCDRVLNPVSFVVRNANGQSDYFTGFPPDCPAADDLDHQLGDPVETSLAEAFTYLRTGACGAASRTPGLRLQRIPLQELQDGWQKEVGAN